ncbi:hypothetical protein C0991_003116, partial [Blastosporella zonata]
MPLTLSPPPSSPFTAPPNFDAPDTLAPTSIAVTQPPAAAAGSAPPAARLLSLTSPAGLPPLALAACLLPPAPQTPRMHKSFAACIPSSSPSSNIFQWPHNEVHHSDDEQQQEWQQKHPCRPVK